MEHKHCIGILSFIIAFSILSLIFAGCAAPATTEPVIVPVTGNQPTVIAPTLLPVIVPVESERNSILSLPDGSKIIFQPKTKVEVISFPNVNSTDVDITIKLIQGDILVIPNPESDKWFSVQNSDGNIAQVNGCGMSVSADQSTKDFGMNCIGGNCMLGMDSKNLFAVNINEAWAIQQGALHGPTPINQSHLEELYAGQLPTCPLTIPVTGEEITPTLPQTLIGDIGATATASCKDFKSRFPGTPCP
jgi:hypothetical protein